MSQIKLETTDKELSNALQSLKIDQLKIGRRIKTFDCADPEIMIAANQISTFVITSLSSVALSLFSSWLYDQLKKKKTEEIIKINGIEISGNNNNLKVEIHNHIYPSESKLNQ